tara:strand:+ start:2330 stop:3349 length:1020 start_codon:yes stop_codon:yes gene_type:complete
VNTLNDMQIEQLRKFNDSIVEHPQIKIIFNDFDELRQNRQYQSDQQCMLLTGDTGVGKSHLINHYKKKVLATQNHSHNTIPILVSRISRGKGFDATLIQILADLELFGSSQRKKRGYQTDLTRKLVESLIKAQVELLILNEFQELIEFKNPKERQDIANGLKFISEEAKVPIVLVGMPWAEKIAEEPQWSSRIVRKRRLEYFSLQNNRNYFIQYIKGLANKMPFDVPPRFEDMQITTALFSACRGENRSLKHLLSESLKLALLSNETLEASHLSLAFDKLELLGKVAAKQKGVEIQNPFKQTLNNIDISEVIKNSQYNSNALDSEHMLTGRFFTRSKNR